MLDNIRRHAGEGLPLGPRLDEHHRALRRGRAALGLVCAILPLTLFALVLLEIAGGILATDRLLARALAGWSAPALYWLLLGVSWLGWQPQVGVIGLGLVALIFRRRLVLESGFALLALVGGTPAYLLLTLLWDRARPYRVVEGIRVYKELGGTSFPSGHVINYLLFCGFLGYVAHTLIRRAWLRRALLAPALALILLVGPSRLYLGQHWLSDVLVSYAVGAALLVGLLLPYRAAKGRQLARAAAPAGQTGGRGHCADAPDRRDGAT